MTINTIGETLGEVYFIRKDAEDEQKKLREDFFLAAALENQSQTLAQKTVVAPSSLETTEKVTAFAKLYNPGWRVIEPVQKFNVVIEQDPDYLPYSIVIPIDDGIIDAKGNEHPGYVITKSIVSGSLTLDDERLRKENLKLYNQVTYIPLLDQARDFWGEKSTTFTDLESAFGSLSVPRVLKSPDLLTPAQSAKIQAYSYESAKTKKLLVRFAKEDELGKG